MAKHRRLSAVVRKAGKSSKKEAGKAGKRRSKVVGELLRGK